MSQVGNPYAVQGRKTGREKCGTGTGSPDFRGTLAGTGCELKNLGGKYSGPGLRKLGAGNGFFFPKLNLYNFDG